MQHAADAEFGDARRSRLNHLNLQRLVTNGGVDGRVMLGVDARF